MTAIVAWLPGIPGVAGAAYVPGRGSGLDQALWDYALEIEAAAPTRLPAPIQYGAPSTNPASPCLLDRAQPA